MRLRIEDCQTAFNRAHRALFHSLPPGPAWEKLLASVAREEAAWTELYNIKIININHRWEEIEFETEADVTAFLLKWS